jgi:hypothetical protein
MAYLAASTRTLGRLIQSFDRRARRFGGRCEGLIACRKVVMQRATEVAQFLDACVDIVDAPREQLAHLSTGRRVVRAQPAGSELLDVVKRQPKRLSLLDELYLVHRSV